MLACERHLLDSSVPDQDLSAIVLVGDAENESRSKLVVEDISSNLDAACWCSKLP